MPSIAVTSLLDRRVCLLLSTCPHTVAMTLIMNVWLAMWVRLAFLSVTRRIWRCSSMVFPWTRCLYLWPWMVQYSLYWRSTSWQVWNRGPRWKRWLVLYKTTFWRNSWCAIPTSTRQHSLWRLLQTSSSLHRRICLSSTLFPSPVITCRRLVPLLILSWLIHWQTVWIISVQVWMQVLT